MGNEEKFKFWGQKVGENYPYSPWRPWRYDSKIRVVRQYKMR
jgi:hypothetical protein